MPQTQAVGAIPFKLRSWQRWFPGRNVDDAKDLPALVRRRVTPLGRHALNAAWALPETKNARFVLSSRHGEFSRTLSLMEALVKDEDLSPADFTLSVHHALAGLLSIAHRNRHGHIAVAAGEESFCFGLLEAAACLTEKPGEPVVLIHLDEPLPGPYVAFSEAGDESIALALNLTAAGEGTHFEAKIEPRGAEETSSRSHAMDFLRFIESEARSCVSVSANRSWRWTRHEAA